MFKYSAFFCNVAVNVTLDLWVLLILSSREGSRLMAGSHRFISPVVLL